MREDATDSETDTDITVGVVGARGYVGAELLPVLERHPRMRVAFAGSRSLAGERVADHVEGWEDDRLRFTAMGPEQVAGEAAETDAGLDACILALPNGKSRAFVEAIDAFSPETIILDVSADHRFDARWTYGLPEHHRTRIVEAVRIANPGCYATAAQLGVRPLLKLLDVPPHLFGVSGYSGAGTSPSPRNDPERLRDNLIPYRLTDHLHEREISEHLGYRVFFSPHVAAFFRGISLTVSAEIEALDADRDTLWQRFVDAYADEPLVELSEETPLVRANAGHPHATVGGLEYNATTGRAALVVTLDNLLKGAATQAVQNLNLAVGFEETTGLTS